MFRPMPARFLVVFIGLGWLGLLALLIAAASLLVGATQALVMPFAGLALFGGFALALWLVPSKALLGLIPFALALILPMDAPLQRLSEAFQPVVTMDSIEALHGQRSGRVRLPDVRTHPEMAERLDIPYRTRRGGSTGYHPDNALFRLIPLGEGGNAFLICAEPTNRDRLYRVPVCGNEDITLREAEILALQERPEALILRRLPEPKAERRDAILGIAGRVLILWALWAASVVLISRRFHGRVQKD